jgi:hypothetical protein
MEISSNATYHVERTGPTAATSPSCSRRKRAARSVAPRAVEPAADDRTTRFAGAGHRQRRAHRAETDDALARSTPRRGRRAAARPPPPVAAARRRQRRRRSRRRSRRRTAAQPQRRSDVQPTCRPGQKQYIGHPINFDFEDADLRAVLRVFSHESGLNMIIDPQVQGA